MHRKKSKTLLRALAVWLVAALFVGFTASAALAEQVNLPISIDYPMLRSLVVGSAFTGPDRTAVLLDEDGGCRRVVLSDPRLRFSDGAVRFETKVTIRVGVMLAETCRLPVQWEGFVVLLQEPRIRSEWRLSFKTTDSFVLGSDRRPAVVAGIVWDLVQSEVIRYLEAVTVDLGPPVAEMKSFLTEVAPAESERVAALLDSLRPEAATATAAALRIDVRGELALPAPVPEASEGRQLTEAEIGEITEAWEHWDAYLAFLISGLSDQPLSDDDRLLLLETLLMLRHEFVAAQNSLELHDDFVRRQFVAAWKNLGPLFRRHLGDEPSKSMLGYLALFSASDALVALDRIGPALGIEISSRGLLRLGRLLDPARPVSLAYTPGLDHRLMEVLGLEDRVRETHRLRMP
ncbi:MAG: hypothetical protein LJE65_06200 [Desulfobacteraceae bacterium]|nr:hypothetical protein [Desulfobacteraceae bacterium]